MRRHVVELSAAWTVTAVISIVARALDGAAPVVQEAMRASATVVTATNNRVVGVDRPCRNADGEPRHRGAAHVRTIGCGLP